MLIHLDGMCVGIDTDNQDEYDSIVHLLTATLHLGIHRLDVFLDSQLNLTATDYVIFVSLEISCALDIWLGILNPFHSCIFPEFSIL